jgi:hypothetical protein
MAYDTRPETQKYSVDNFILYIYDEATIYPSCYYYTTIYICMSICMFVMWLVIHMTRVAEIYCRYFNTFNTEAFILFIHICAIILFISILYLLSTMF